MFNFLFFDNNILTRVLLRS